MPSHLRQAQPGSRLVLEHPLALFMLKVALVGLSNQTKTPRIQQTAGQAYERATVGVTHSEHLVTLF